MIDGEKNICSIILSSPKEESIAIKIDIYSDYYDLFVKDEEVVIQQEIIPVDKTSTFIQNHLKSTVEEVEVLSKSDSNKAVKSQITFYLGDKKVNSVGSISIIPYLFNSNRKKMVKYIPWLNE